MKKYDLFDLPPKCFNIDITGFCNLRCTFCPEGQKLNQQPVKYMNLSSYINILNSLPNNITNIGLTNWSEPFLNKEIIDIIKYTKKHYPDIIIWASSNGNAFRGEVAEETVNSQLDYLEITISGLTDEIYQKYHDRGKLSRVFSALNEITKAKSDYNSMKPNLTINYLLFPYNLVSENEIKQAIGQNLSHEDQLQQINAIRIIRGTMLGTQAILKTMAKRFPDSDKLFQKTTHFKSFCLQLFQNPSVRADGAVFPCCINEYRDSLEMGNLNEHNFIDIWQSQKYRQFRHDFLAGKNNICNKCYLKYSPLSVFHSNHFKLRLKSNLKLMIQQWLKHIFIIDNKFLDSKLFQLWVRHRLLKEMLSNK